MRQQPGLIQGSSRAQGAVRTTEAGFVRNHRQGKRLQGGTKLSSTRSRQTASLGGTSERAAEGGGLWLRQAKDLGSGVGDEEPGQLARVVGRCLLMGPQGPRD